jgi:ABC-2 type transport system permease protein
VRGLLAGEWTKLRSVRSTWWALAVYVVVVGGFGWLAAATTPTAPAAGFAVGVALTGFGFGQLVLVVLGVLAASSEFATGMALATFTAVPRRVRLLAAKTAVVAGGAALLSLLLAAGCALAARTLTAVPGGVPLADGVVLRPLLLQTVGAGLLTVLGVGLGTAFRSTAGGVGLGTALVFVLPPGLALAGGAVAERLSQALPALRVGEDAFLAVDTSWPVGLAVTAGWAAAVWLLAAVLLVRRDV